MYPFVVALVYQDIKVRQSNGFGLTLVPVSSQRLTSSDRVSTRYSSAWFNKHGWATIMSVQPHPKDDMEFNLIDSQGGSGKSLDFGTVRPIESSSAGRLL